MGIDYIDEAEAPDYIGKVVLLGVTYLDHEEKLIEQKQWAGIITTFSKKDGIKIEIRGSNDPCTLPPDFIGLRAKLYPSYVEKLERLGKVDDAMPFRMQK